MKARTHDEVLAEELDELRREQGRVAITVIGLTPVAARFVSDVCRMSWKARILPSTPASASAFRNSPRYHSASSLEPRHEPGARCGRTIINNSANS